MKVNLQGSVLLRENPDGTTVYRFVENGRTRDVTVYADGNLIDERRWLKEPPGGDPRTGGPWGNVEKRPI